MASAQPQQFWLFQYKEEVRTARSLESSKPGQIVNWRATQHKTRIQSGDVVFYWRAGQNAGLKGWGVAESETTPASKDDEFDHVPVRTVANFEEAIPRDRVRAVSEVSDLAVIMQGRQGTNFPVSTLQAFGLARLIATHGYNAPTVDINEARAVVQRRVQRDLAELREAVQGLPSARAAPLVLRIEQLTQGLSSSTWDPSVVAREIDALRTDAEAAADTPDESSQASQPTLDYRRAAQQVAANISDLSVLGGDDGFAQQPEAGAVGESAREATAELPLPTTTPPPPSPPLPPPTAPPGFWRWHEKDRVGIGADVANLARYIGHENLRPPQAIGVFGDWGSGKTFFMDALKSQIALTAWQSRLALEQGRRSVFCSRVVQIDFNAWHYVESNLWASLAGHIFERLHLAMVAEAAANPTQRLDANALFEGLATYREAMEERTRRSALVSELNARQEDLKRELSAKAGTIQSAVSHAATVVLNLARAQFDALGKTQRERLRRLVGAESVDALALSEKELGKVLIDADTLRKQVAVDVQTMSRWGYAIGLVIVAAAIVGLPFLAARVRDALDEVIPALAAYRTLAQATLTFAGYLVSAVAVVKTLAARGRRLLDVARTAHEKLMEERKKAESDQQPVIAEAQAKIAAANEALKESDEILRKRREDLAEVEAALGKANPGLQLKTFLEERVRDKSYEQHLGLISLVRRDFQTLSDRMREYWATRVSGYPFAEVDVVADDGLTIVKKRVPFVERIVLYVDDLDRCPPEKVVDVLQAVHLLLGFELFVVAVAVDVRWVGRSLTKQYTDLLSTTDFADAAGASWERASSDDYLEKIFQIPFRLVPLNDAAREQFVRARLREPFIGQQAEDSTAAIPAVDLEPKEAALYPEEIECIEALHACLGRSPRRVNRFVNVYRLMRAGMEEGEVQSLIQRKSYRQLLALFALLTGSAHLGPKLIEELHRTLRGKGIASGEFEKWLRAFPDLSKYDEDEVASASTIFSYFDRLGNETSAAVLLEWMPQVAQYSFRQVRLAGT